MSSRCSPRPLGLELGRGADVCRLGLVLVGPAAAILQRVDITRLSQRFVGTDGALSRTPLGLRVRPVLGMLDGWTHMK